MNNAKITILGNLVKDPTTTEVNGTPVLNFSVGVSTNIKNADGTFKSNFYTVSLWGKAVETIGARLQKGTQVQVLGDFSADVYTTKTDGKQYPDLKITAYSVIPLAKQKDLRVAKEEELPY